MRGSVILATIAACSFSVPGGAGPELGADAADTSARDTDGDGIPDSVDVCPYVVDPEQRDHDGDHRGDLCDVCPHLADSGADTDLDGVGDACDPHPMISGDRIAYFEGFYQPVAWNAVIGGNVWTFANGAVHQPSTATAYQLIRDDNPDLGHVTVDARFAVDQITGDTSNRRSAGIVTGYRDTDTYWFCGLAAAGTQAEVDAGKVSWGLFGDTFDFNLGGFPATMPGGFAVLRAQMSQAANGDASIACTITRNGITGTATYATSAAVSGDIGLRTNGAAASFDYVFVVASP